MNGAKLQTSHSGGAYNEALKYDKNRNIQTLTRTGTEENELYNTSIDNLKYFYNTDNKNLLEKVVDLTHNPEGFKDDANAITVEDDTEDDYEYDNYGNMVSDQNKGITSITYNHLNLPKIITFGTTGTITYLYDATGAKLKKMVTQDSIVTTTDYLSGVQYLDEVLQFFPTAEGYVEPTETGGYQYVYNYTDHLGNNRLSYTFDTTTSSLQMREENNYYPFGLKQKGYNDETVNSEYKYKYNGKELQDELGLNVYNYGARMYDPVSPRWWQLDPYAEKYETASPYAYVLNNPINAIDPNGKLIVYVNGLLFSQAASYKLDPINAIAGALNKRWAYRPESFGTRIWQNNEPIFNFSRIDYWGKPDGAGSIRNIINTAFQDNHNVFVNGSNHFKSQASDRFALGQKAGNELIAQLQNGTIELAEGETIKIVGHSQGAAHAAGMLKALMDSEYASRVEIGIYLSPHQPGDFTHPDGVMGMQFSTLTDTVSGGWYLEPGGTIGGSKLSFWGLNGGSEFSVINGLKEGKDYIYIRTSYNGARGGHNVESWAEILKKINEFLNSD